MNRKQNVSASRHGATPYDGATSNSKGDIIQGDGWLGTDSVVGDIYKATFGTFFVAHPQR